MHFTHALIIFLKLLFAFPSEGAYYTHLVIRCQSSSHDGHDAVYLEEYCFNKKLIGLYNSTLGKLVGYTKQAQEIANNLNNHNIPFVKNEKWKTSMCRSIVPTTFDGFLKTVEPKVWLRAVDAVDGKHPNKLICSMYDFYPKQMRVTWLRDGKKVSPNVMSTEELPSGNWLYQLHSYLEFIPQPGEKITCVVEHASLIKPKFFDWEPEPKPSMKKYFVGTAGLLVGLLFSLTGFIYYKRSTDSLEFP